jgi:Golgi apparatus protein 1
MTIDRNWMRFLVVAGAATFLSTSAWAAGEAKNACGADVEKLCSGMSPGEGKIVSCLNEHKSELSPGCTSYMTKVKQQMKTVGEACEPDVEKFCWQTPAGKGGIASCLKSHKDDLSADCKTAITKAKAAHSQHKTPAMQ